MTWLTPLGFLGLIGLIILIIIYIIKPNYQQKYISTTFVWKLSLKYKRKKIPISKLRNILLFLCQILAITACATILAQPFIDNSKPETVEKVLIIDASGSMLSNVGGQTRFERAVDEMRAEAEEVLKKENGKVSIILASTKASFLVQQADNMDDINAALDELVDPATGLACTYGKVDIEAAIRLSEEVTAIVPDVEVQLYTDSEYIDPGKVVVKTIRDIADWNAAILDVRAIMDENTYRFEIDVACFGKNADITVYCAVSGVNGENDTLELQGEARCIDGETLTLVFSTAEESKLAELHSYTHLYVHVEEMDALDVDNSFYLYGGEKPMLRVQYYSKAANNYVSSAIMVIRNQLKYRWNVEFVEVPLGGKAENEGFDLYIYEHEMPTTVPTDGAVLLLNPDSVPSNAGFRLGNSKGSGQQTNMKKLSAGENHPVLRGLVPEAIAVSRWTTISSYDGYTPVLYVDNDPVFIVKNEPNQKIGVMSFSLNFSNLPVMLEFPMMLYNIIEYFIPSTVTEYVFDVNETISLGSRSEELSVMGNGLDEVITEFPAKLLLVKPGVYTVSQTPLSGVDVIENFYVKIPAAESNINTKHDSLANPYMYSDPVDANTDLLLYFAIALVALLFMEWWLHTREQY